MFFFHLAHLRERVNSQIQCPLDMTLRHTWPKSFIYPKSVTWSKKRHLTKRRHLTKKRHLVKKSSLDQKASLGQKSVSWPKDVIWPKNVTWSKSVTWPKFFKGVDFEIFLHQVKHLPSDVFWPSDVFCQLTVSDQEKLLGQMTHFWGVKKSAPSGEVTQISYVSEKITWNFKCRKVFRLRFSKILVI